MFESLFSPEQENTQVKVSQEDIHIGEDVVKSASQSRFFFKKSATLIRGTLNLLFSMTKEIILEENPCLSLKI